MNGEIPRAWRNQVIVRIALPADASIGVLKDVFILEALLARDANGDSECTCRATGRG